MNVYGSLAGPEPVRDAAHCRSQPEVFSRILTLAVGPSTSYCLATHCMIARKCGQHGCIGELSSDTPGSAISCSLGEQHVAI